MFPQLPLELVHEIVHHILDSAPPRCDSQDLLGVTSKPSWVLIEPFTQSSRAFRLLCLESWFRRLYLRSALDILTIDQYFPALKSTWCRHFHCVQTKDPYKTIFAWDLSGFQQLSSLRVDWLSRKSTFRDDFTPFLNVESRILEVDIRGVKYPSPMVLKSLTCAFVHLVTLKLDFPRIWCGLCHTCILVRFPSPPPTSLKYEGGLGLPVHYSRALFSLNEIEEVIIRLPDFGFGLPSPGLSAHSNDNLWVGECDRCMSLMYDDEEFRKRWIARKRGLDSAGVRRDNTTPPRLKKVQWNFWQFDTRGDGTRLSRHETNSDEESLTDYDGDDREEGESNEAHEII
ncbi:hypothetical protein GALMADRAFT_255116 [Galerina marginata CBS 339.88]|uniref:Uncharacterized protein n=1 Tax=Galerina marginata (strain CBS 339.88) TaxID=685588 RepID=A0A067STY3_GALM3|nr:hypothetical protein GALMADRAFT_255116 [Galerina marginata CBS 339.88]